MDGDRRGLVVRLLNQILEQELAGVIRYTHYSLMVFGYSRIRIVSWFRGEATESLRHAEQAGELITHLGAYPSLGIGPLMDSHRTDLRSMLEESLAVEDQALALYRQLLQAVEGHSALIEDYAFRMVATEEMHADEVRKMLGSPVESPPAG